MAAIGQGKAGERCFDYTVRFETDRKPDSGTVAFGELRLIPVSVSEAARIELQPAKSVDLGEGKGAPVARSMKGGVVGLLLDGRGRPLQLPADAQARVAALVKWHRAVELYPT